MTAELRSANELADERTTLGVKRTGMAAERTLMAWIRTALALIGFGFTIYKFLVAATQGANVGAISPQGPQRLGLFLIGLGVLSVVAGLLEYFRMIAYLNELSPQGQRLRPMNACVFIAAAIGLLGLLLFITTIVNSKLI